MAITQDELNSIVSSVLSSIRTNSKTIEQMTPATSLGETDYFEVSGGKKVSYSVLKELIGSMSTEDQDSLRTQIEQAKLKSVSITTTETSATLTIQSVGKTITCTIPTATTSSGGLMSAADKVKVNSAYDLANSAKTTADNALSQAEGAASTAESASQVATEAKTLAQTAKTRADAAKAVTDTKGQPNGIATLDEKGLIPEYNIPGKYDDVVEFQGYIMMTSAPQMQSYGGLSTDENCSVLFDTVNGVFVISVETVSTTGKQTVTYNNWFDGPSFGEISSLGRVPQVGKVYVDINSNKMYRWSGSEMVVIGSDLALGHTETTAFPGNEGAELQEKVVLQQTAINENATHINNIGILKADGEWNGNRDEPIYGVWLVSDGEGGVYWRSFGDTNFYGYPEEAYNPDMANELCVYRIKNELYRIKDGILMGMAGSSVGNCYNVTNEVPIIGSTNPYYTLESAIQVAYEKGKNKLGMQITFAIADKSWKTYQYVGSTIDDEFINPANWIDTAGISAGDEPIINVTKLCGMAPVEGANMLTKAIAAVADFSRNTGIEYRKSGIILTYKVADQTWETKQFIGDFTKDANEAEFENESLWKDFGGGGNDVIEVTDEAVENSEKVFSSGGAYKIKKQAIVDFLESQDDDNIYYQPLNAFGEQVGTVITVPKSGGSGSTNLATLAIYFENNDSAPAFSFGADIIVKFAAKSSTYDSGNEVLNTIRSIAVVDYSTGLTLSSEVVNASSSTSAADTKFSVNLTDYFSAASTKDFQIVVTDDSGNTRKKMLTVTALDITVQSSQTLNYTSGTALEVGGNVKSILMYRFPNNASTQGIKCTTEIYYQDEWKVLGTAVIQDTYSKSISINPRDLFGNSEQLRHGTYMLRIQGEDVKTGIKGNILYSSIMCVEAGNKTPLVAIRYSDMNKGILRLYDNLSVDVAAYTVGQTSTEVSVNWNGSAINTQSIITSAVHKVTKQVQGFNTDGSDNIIITASSGSVVTTPEIVVNVLGSAIGAELKSGAVISYDFSTRSNSETDHTITSGGYTMAINGSNWSSNGFAKYLGENCLRIAENVTANIPYAPFGNAAVEQTNGVAIQFAFATNNVADDDKILVDCYDAESGAGFYIKGNKLAIFCKTGNPQLVERTFKCGEKHTVAIVVEPSTIYLSREGTNYSNMKLYLDGEMVGCIGYISGSGAILNTKTINFDGTLADIYLYYFLAYESYMQWAEAFKNYLCKMSDTTAMISEYSFENVLDSQNAPSLSKIAEKGMPYYCVVADQSVFDSFDSDINTSENFKCTLIYHDPQRPWKSFKAINVRWRRQGTTSAKRPIKNDRFYLAKEKGWKITPLYPDYTTAEALRAYKLMELGYIQVGENTIPVRIITVKVDYSDASGANDCGVCDTMNATYKALGKDYMTPAQNAFNGTWTKGDYTLTGLEMNHSTANHPIAAFRATLDSLADATFHAKGNWKEDKGEQVALGFKDTPGYNLGCLNYGDFIDYIGDEGENIDEIEARFKTESSLDTDAVYLLSLYCGRDYRFMRYVDGAWKASTGSMKYTGGKWVISGDVLNPVTGFELLTYDGMDWWQGVNGIEDMMAPSSAQSSWVTKLKLGKDTYPAWTYYFECMVDDDQLQIDYALGKKVPYELFNVLRFCGSCDYKSVVGFETIWKNNAWKYINPNSLAAYYAFTDYYAAVDQQAKNMQPMFFLEQNAYVENGKYYSNTSMEALRMYLNKVYDCDTCNGKDNDGFPSIKPNLNPEDTEDKSYAGRGSVLWNNLRKQPTMNIDDSGNTITLKGIVSTMRNLPDTENIGAGPFSPQGALHYFVDMRLKRWQKVVSSYDGERKYVKSVEKSDAIYFYALQGLGLASLPRFIEERWRYRDGCYECGEFMSASHYLTGRIGAKEGAVIRFKAAKDGYFAVGNDGGNARQGMYLKAGETGVFNDFQHGDNVLLYLFNADLMSELDLSEISLDSSWSFSKMSLIEKLVIGSNTHKNWTTSPSASGFLTNVQLGSLPFLKELDLRNTEIEVVDAASCPRLETVYADGTALSSISLAETSPISILTLPDTIANLTFVNLPNLTYPGGLSIAGYGKVSKVMISGCPKIDFEKLLLNVVSTASIKYIRLAGVNVTASSNVLRLIMESGAIGLDQNGTAYDESGQCSGLSGRWIMSDLIEDAELNSLDAYFPQLEVHNSQFSVIMFDDTATDAANITNIDDSTGYLFNNEYTAPKHILRILSKSHAYKCTFNSKDGKMHLVQLSDSTYEQYADGTAFDTLDTSGIGYDVMKNIPKYHYKGVNDFKNQRKYFIASYLTTTPISTATKCVRKKLSEIFVESNKGVVVDGAVIGGEYETATASGNIYAINVEGMKQVRFPGINSNVFGGVFLDEDDKIISTFNMYVTHAFFDFNPNIGDYVFTDIPLGAVKFVFTSPLNLEEQECIVVDSTHIEAIEPDWVYTGYEDNDAIERLVGVYEAYLDPQDRMRSKTIQSGETTRRGLDGTSGSMVNNNWTYDSDGNVTNAAKPDGNMYYCGGDLINLCRMRGTGYYAIDYEMHKDLTNLIYGLIGTRDGQGYAGAGRSAGHVTGLFNKYGNTTLKNASDGNLLIGLQNFIGVSTEWLDNLGLNVSSVVDFRRSNFSEGSGFPIDDFIHVYDPIRKSERLVKYLTSTTSYTNIARVRFGRFADITCSKVAGDTVYNTYYCDGAGYSRLRGRLPARAGGNAYANAGLAYLYANNAGSYTSTSYGARLAFIGECVYDDTTA